MTSQPIALGRRIDLVGYTLTLVGDLGGVIPDLVRLMNRLFRTNCPQS